MCCARAVGLSIRGKARAIVDFIDSTLQTGPIGRRTPRVLSIADTVYMYYLLSTISSRVQLHVCVLTGWYRPTITTH